MRDNVFVFWSIQVCLQVVLTVWCVTSLYVVIAFIDMWMGRSDESSRQMTDLASLSCVTMRLCFGQSKFVCKLCCYSLCCDRIHRHVDRSIG